MAARISREFLDRMRDDPDFLEATPGDASEAVAIIDLAISALSHPAALERARAEERERCAAWVSDEWKPMDPPGMYEAEALADAYTSGEIDAAASIADCIRHVLPVPRPSPDAYTADDGSVSEDVLRAKVPELIGAALERARAEGAVAIANGFILSRDLLRRVVPLLHWMIAHRAKVGPDNAVAAAAIATAIGALPSDPCAPDGALNTALEAARAEERERIDDLLTGLNVDPIKAAPEAHVGDFYAGVDAGINAALDAIRALGPAPRPSPEAEPVDLSGGPPNDKLKTLYAEGRAMLATPPALAPELRERARKLLAMPANIDNWTTYCIEAHDILSALFPQTDGGAK